MVLFLFWVFSEVLFLSKSGISLVDNKYIKMSEWWKNLKVEYCFVNWGYIRVLKEDNNYVE